MALHTSIEQFPVNHTIECQQAASQVRQIASFYSPTSFVSYMSYSIVQVRITVIPLKPAFDIRIFYSCIFFNKKGYHHIDRNKNVKKMPSIPGWPVKLKSLLLIRKLKKCEQE